MPEASAGRPPSSPGLASPPWGTAWDAFRPAASFEPGWCRRRERPARPPLSFDQRSGVVRRGAVRDHAEGLRRPHATLGGGGLLLDDRDPIAAGARRAERRAARAPGPRHLR